MSEGQGKKVVFANEKVIVYDDGSKELVSASDGKAEQESGAAPSGQVQQEPSDDQVSAVAEQFPEGFLSHLVEQFYHACRRAKIEVDASKAHVKYAYLSMADLINSLRI